MNDAGRYEVAYDPKVIKELKKLDKPMARRVTRAVDALATDPRPASSKSLVGYVGYPDLRRLRVGDYRVIYTVRDTELIVLALRVGIAVPSTAASEQRDASS